MQTLTTVNSEFTPARPKPLVHQEHHVHIHQTSPLRREVADVQLIKYLSRNNQRHTSRPRPRRRPKPVYGPPAYNHGTPLNEPTYAKPPKTSYSNPQPIHDDPLPPQVSYFPFNNYESNQQNSFAEPPSTVRTDSVLPIQHESSAYKLPPSTSYGVPVSPIINVYPDKSEYMKNNQPPSLYNLYDETPSVIQPTSYHVPPSNQPAYNFAEPTLNSSLYKYNFPTGYYTGKDPYSSTAAIGEISEEGSFPPDDSDDYGFDASLDRLQPKPSNEISVRHRTKVRIPSDQFVDDLLVLPKEPIGSSSTQTHSQPSPFLTNFNHNLDTDDLRESYSAGGERRVTKTRPKPKKRKNHQPSNHRAKAPTQFGARIGAAKKEKTITTTTSAAPKTTSATTESFRTTTEEASSTEQPTNFVLLSAANDAKSDLSDSIPTQDQKKPDVDMKTTRKRNVAGRISNYHRVQPKEKEPTPTITAKLDSPRPSVEILSIDKSRSISFYAGTVATPEAAATTSGNSGSSTHIVAQSQGILSDVIASIR